MQDTCNHSECYPVLIGEYLIIYLGESGFALTTSQLVPPESRSWETHRGQRTAEHESKEHEIWME